MDLNFLIIILAALIPLALGFVWYNPKVFGNTWMRESGVTPEKAKQGNILLIFGLSLILSFLLAFSLNFIVIHQYHLTSTLMGEPGFGEKGSQIMKYLSEFMENYGDNFRTFKHGAFHGVFTGITIALPILAINALFERKSFKYVLLHAGFWIIALALMGGVICQFA